MKKRRLCRIRVATTLLMLLLISGFSCIPAFAAGTEIYTVVPDYHTITVEVGPDGTVIDAEGVSHTERFTVKVPHGRSLGLILRPDSDYELESVLFDGQDRRSAVYGGRLQIDNVHLDGNLAVTFRKTSVPPSSEGTYTIVGIVAENGKPCQGISLELRSSLKTYLTGSDGKFRFENVEPGFHSITALRDGKTVGYLTFTLKEGGEGVHVQKLSDGTFQLTVAGDVTMLELALSINENGLMEITSAAPITTEQAKKNYPPATGDDSKYFEWAAIMTVSGFIIVFLYREFRKRKIKSKN